MKISGFEFLEDCRIKLTLSFAQKMVIGDIESPELLNNFNFMVPPRPALPNELFSLYYGWKL